MVKNNKLASYITPNCYCQPMVPQSEIIAVSKGVLIGGGGIYPGDDWDGED